MGLVIIILLGLIVFMMVFIDNVLCILEVILLIGKYLVIVFVQVIFVLLVMCGVLRIYYKDFERKMFVWFCKLIFDILGLMLLVIFFDK